MYNTVTLSHSPYLTKDFFPETIKAFHISIIRQALLCLQKNYICTDTSQNNIYIYIYYSRKCLYKCNFSVGRAGLALLLKCGRLLWSQERSPLSNMDYEKVSLYCTQTYNLFLQLYALTFHFLKDFFQRAKVFVFDEL